MRTLAQIPSGSRKVSSPDSRLMPAPVRITMLRGMAKTGSLVLCFGFGQSGSPQRRLFLDAAYPFRLHRQYLSLADRRGAVPRPLGRARARRPVRGGFRRHRRLPCRRTPERARDPDRRRARRRPQPLARAAARGGRFRAVRSCPRHGSRPSGGDARLGARRPAREARAPPRLCAGLAASRGTGSLLRRRRRLSAELRAHRRRHRRPHKAHSLRPWRARSSPPPGRWRLRRR